MADLSVRGETLQRVYNLYRNDRFQVNRRYQRKLVWDVQEKERLVDSISKDLPLPLFLVAEIDTDGETIYELIDGMQRMNAVFAFFEQEFALDGHYFDLDALADTKVLKDTGVLEQQLPVLSRTASVEFANYTIALSSFRAPTSGHIDEVFRRINSGGRRLSRQELRQAGTVSPLADLVRRLSSRIRGDTSPSDIVALRTMPQLSITNKNLDYGVNVEDIYWVSKGILRREDVRGSADEQLVLDLVIDCLITPLPNSGPAVRDSYYDYSADDDTTEHPPAEISAALATHGVEQFQDDFMRTYDAVRQVLDESDEKLTTLLELQNSNRAPRYFHTIFLAFWDALVVRGKRIRDPEEALSRLRGRGSALAIPSGGGDWRTDAKRKSVNKVKQFLRNVLEDIPKGEDLAVAGYASELETILGNALVEQQTFECKQGLYTLDDERSLQTDLIEKMARTLVAMANLGPGTVGYVLVGIADDDADAARIASLDHVEVKLYRGFNIVGLEREAALHKTDLNGYWMWLTQKLEAALPKEIRGQVSADARLANYRDRRVGIFKVAASTQPVFFSGALLERRGSRTTEVSQRDFMRVYSRYSKQQ